MTEENLQTWESASQDTPPPAVDPSAEPIPAEPQTLEETATPPLEAVVEAARESESAPEQPSEPVVDAPKTEEYVAEVDDPPEIAGLNTAASKRWAKRQFKDAEPIRNYLDFERPIKEFADDLFKRSESRYAELVDDILAHDRDYISHKLFGVSFNQVKGRPQDGKSEPPPANQPAPLSGAPTLPTAEELQNLSNEEIAQRFKDFHAAKEKEAQDATAKLQQEVADLRAQFDAVNGKVANREKEAFQARVSEETNKLHDKVWGTVIDGGIRDSGLEVQPSDPLEIANLKKAAARILRSEVDREFAGEGADESKLTESQKANRKVISRVVEAARRGEFQNAWAEEDNLTIRGRAAFEAVKNSDEVQALLKRISDYANQSMAKPRAANPAPPAPGSSTGVTITSPTTWDEAEKAPNVLTAA